MYTLYVHVYIIHISPAPRRGTAAAWPPGRRPPIITEPKDHQLSYQLSFDRKLFYDIRYCGFQPSYYYVGFAYDYLLSIVITNPMIFNIY